MIMTTFMEVDAAVFLQKSKLQDLLLDVIGSN